MAKRKPPIVLDIDEMINDPSQRGMLSFLDVPPEEKRRMAAGQSVPFPAEAVEDVGTDSTVPIISKGTDSIGIESATTETKADDSLAYDSKTTLQFGAKATTRRRPFRVAQVQDCHTPAEHRVFLLLLSLAKDPQQRFGRTEPDGSSLCWASQPEIARRVRMHENNVRTILRSLAAKLSIEQVGEADRSEGKGRTWRIRPFEEIAELRRKSNLTWAIKSGGGQIKFVAPEEVERLVALRAELDSIGTESVPT